MLQFKRIIDKDFHDRDTYAYMCEDDLFKAKIMRCLFGGWTYDVHFVDKDLSQNDRRPITSSAYLPQNHRQLLRSIFKTQEAVRRIIELLHKAKDKGPDYYYLIRGVQLGFLYEEDMDHLKDVVKKEWEHLKKLTGS